MDEFIIIVVEVEKVLGKIGETPYEPLHEENEEKLTLGKTSIDKHLTTIIHGCDRLQKNHHVKDSKVRMMTM
jgi:hypothetical protein